MVLWELAHKYYEIIVMKHLFLFKDYHDIHFESCAPYEVVGYVRTLVEKAMQDGYDSK